MLNAQHAKCIYFIACRDLLVDQPSNNSSIIRVLEEVAVQGNQPGPGIAPLPFVLASLWQKRVYDSEEVRFVLKRPTQPDMVLAGLTIKFDKPRNRVALSVNALPISGPGEYTFLAQVKDGADWLDAGEFPLQVNMPLNP